jgi:hypothetical protein
MNANTAESTCNGGGGLESMGDVEDMRQHTTNATTMGTVHLTSVDNLVPRNQEFCFTSTETIIGQVKK